MVAEVAVLSTVPAGLGAQLAFPSYMAILSPDFGAPKGLGPDPMPCRRLPSQWRIAGDLEKECPDMSVDCFPCGCELALCSLKGQVWLIIPPCEEVWKGLCGEWWVEHWRPWTVVQAGGSGRGCAVELRQRQQAVRLCIAKAELVLCCESIIGICLAGYGPACHP